MWHGIETYVSKLTLCRDVSHVTGKWRGYKFKVLALFLLDPIFLWGLHKFVLNYLTVLDVFDFRFQRPVVLDFTHEVFTKGCKSCRG